MFVLQGLESVDPISAHEPGLPEGVPGIVIAIHTFGEILISTPTCTRWWPMGCLRGSGVFHVMPETGLKPLEELFRARVSRFLVDKGLLPPERARMLARLGSLGLHVHRGRRVLSREREDMERLAQYIIRNPFFGRKDVEASRARLRHPDRSSTAPA